MRGLLAVELAQPGEHHGADRDVDADAQRVGAADHLEQAELRELLDQHAVLRQQAGVVQADAVPEPLAHVGAVGAAELEAGDPRGDLGLLLAGRDLQAGEVLRAAGGVGLGEVDDVGRASCASSTSFSMVCGSGISA